VNETPLARWNNECVQKAALWRYPAWYVRVSPADTTSPIRDSVRGGGDVYRPFHTPGWLSAAPRELEGKGSSPPNWMLELRAGSVESKRTGLGSAGGSRWDLRMVSPWPRAVVPARTDGALEIGNLRKHFDWIVVPGLGPVFPRGAGQRNAARVLP
jgi:hypothetical protein